VSVPKVVSVAAGSPAQRCGLEPGDELLRINGSQPTDVIEYQRLVDEGEVDLEVGRGGIVLELVVSKEAGEPLGAEISSPIFDRVRTCDNHCEFCFIYQLPKGLRRSLYVKDDDFRLSFLYGNFTTLTRFTEADLERVVTERLSPLYVSIHATDPEVRSRLLRNPRGAISLRWLAALLDAGIEVHGQVVLCPGVNDGPVLEDTMAGIAERFVRLASVGVVPVGVSRYQREGSLVPIEPSAAGAVIDTVEAWQQVFLRLVSRRLVFAADELYLLAGRALPGAEAYEGFPQHENGVGMARAFIDAFSGRSGLPGGSRSGFFAAVDGAPATGYRAPRQGLRPVASAARPSARGCRPVGVLTGEYGAMVLEPLLRSGGFNHARTVVVQNRFFGGNIAVAGLLVGEDVADVLRREPSGHRYLLPDVCFSGGRFLDGLSVESLPRPVEVVPTDGQALRRALLEPRRERLAVAVSHG